MRNVLNNRFVIYIIFEKRKYQYIIKIYYIQYKEISLLKSYLKCEKNLPKYSIKTKFL